MANNTYVAISTATVGSGGSANMTFSSIPATYTDLKIVVNARTNRSDPVDLIKIGFNTVNTNQTAVLLYTVGTSVLSTTDSSIYLPCNGNTATSSIFGYTEFYIPNYLSTTNAKSVDAYGTNEDNISAFTAYAVFGLWNPGTQAAITSIALTSYYSSNFLQHSTATLYGIKSS